MMFKSEKRVKLQIWVSIHTILRFVLNVLVTKLKIYAAYGLCTVRIVHPCLDNIYISVVIYINVWCRTQLDKNVTEQLRLPTIAVQWGFSSCTTSRTKSRSLPSKIGEWGYGLWTLRWKITYSAF
jgi:hypothetical protein